MSLSRNAFYNSAAGLIRIGLTIITMPLLIRLLGVKEYGLWTLVSALVEVIVFAGNGISVTSTIFISKDVNQVKGIDSLSQTLTILFGGVFLISSLAAFGIFFASKYIASAFPLLDINQTTVVISSLNIGSFIVWTRLCQQVLIGIEQAFQQYGSLNLLNTIQYLLLNLGFLIITRYDGATLQLMQWQAVVYFLLFALHCWLTRKILSNLKILPLWNRQKFFDIVNHSLITLVACLGSIVFNKGDRIIVAYYLSPASLGVYAGITEVASAIINFSSLPVQPIVPLLSGFPFGDDRDTKLKYQIKQTLEISGLISVLCGSWLFVLSPVITEFLFSNSSDLSIVNSLKTAVTIYTFISFYTVGFNALLSLSIVSAAIVYLVSATLSLALISYGAASTGLVGAVIGNSGFLFCWLMLFIAMKKMSLPRLFWLECLGIPISLFSCTILALYLLQLNLFASVAVNSLTMIILLLWFGYIQREKILNTMKKFKIS
jgi:O-antigen/teichoic acid export membrane protein